MQILTETTHALPKGSGGGGGRRLQRFAGLKPGGFRGVQLGLGWELHSPVDAHATFPEELRPVPEEPGMVMLVGAVRFDTAADEDPQGIGGVDDLERQQRGADGERVRRPVPGAAL